MMTMIRDPIQSVFGDLVSDVNPYADFGSFVPRPLRRGKKQGAAMSLIALDAWETDQDFRVMAEIPGVSKENIDVNVDGRVLYIRIKKEEPDFSKVQNMLFSEIYYGSETRSLRLPNYCSDDASCCNFKDGVLCICFPKSGPQTKKLHIEVGGGQTTQNQGTGDNQPLMDEQRDDEKTNESNLDQQQQSNQNFQQQQQQQQQLGKDNNSQQNI